MRHRIIRSPAWTLHRQALTSALALVVIGGCGGGGGNNAPAPANAQVAPGNVFVETGWPQFSYPSSGQLSVDSSHPFQWASVPNAVAYQLQVGTSLEAHDIFDSGIISGTSVTVPNLPSSGVVYARVRAILKGWSTDLISGYPRASHVAFRMDAGVEGATFVAPAAGRLADADTAVTWTADPLAQFYQLLIGTSKGDSDLLDSGPIHSRMRVVPGLPAGQVAYATLKTTYAGAIVRSQEMSYTVGAPTTTSAGMLIVARSLTADVREMADTDNQPYDGTPLISTVGATGTGVADCNTFAVTLLSQLSDANVTLQSRLLAACLNPNSYDCHALVEILDTDTMRWVTLDPTFGLYALNFAGQPATSAEISAAARAQAFTQLSYEFLTPRGNAYALAYYIDYPLLFIDIYQPDSSALVEPAPPTLQPYFDLVGSATSSPYSDYYAIQCAAGYTSATANWDGSTKTYGCLSGFTPVFSGISVSLIASEPSAAAVWRIHRFFF